jgi:hypothetical protein
MKRSRNTKLAAAAGMTVVLAAGVFSGPHSARASDEDRRSEEAKVRRGLEIAPVPLNLAGRDVNLVGLGSYIVNAQSSCNDCHSAGPATQFAQGGNPYLGQQPARQNAATYLGGGRNFGALLPNTPNIVSRNLTPDGSGRTLGGDSFQKFLHTMRSGEDPDRVHPTCTETSTTPCLPAPFDGNALQIMPWPVLQQMTEHDLLAIYEYLGAIPCVEGGPGESAGRCR